MMAIERAPAAPHLTLVWKQDEARVEHIAGLDEAVEGAEFAYAIVSGLAADYQHENRPTDLRWSMALHAIGRVGARASAAKAEVLALTDPEPAA